MKELRVKDDSGATILRVEIDVTGESFIRSFVSPIKAMVGEVSLLNPDEAQCRENLQTDTYKPISFNKIIQTVARQKALEVDAKENHKNAS